MDRGKRCPQKVIHQKVPGLAAGWPKVLALTPQMVLPQFVHFGLLQMVSRFAMLETSLTPEQCSGPPAKLQSET